MQRTQENSRSSPVVFLEFSIVPSRISCTAVTNGIPESDLRTVASDDLVREDGVGDDAVEEGQEETRLGDDAEDEESVCGWSDDVAGLSALDGADVESGGAEVGMGGPVEAEQTPESLHQGVRRGDAFLRVARVPGLALQSSQSTLLGG